jgi:hypothetical protein
MAANSLYLLVIIRFAAKDQRVQPYYVLIRAVAGMPMSSIVGTGFRLPKLGSTYHSAGMSDLAIYRQLTGEREQNAQNTAKLPITPFSGNYGTPLVPKADSSPMCQL